MKVFIATKDFYSSVSSLFEGHEVNLLPKDYRKVSMDLLVFTGGEDVHPNEYGEPAPEHGWFNTQRDRWEIQVMRDVLSNRVRVKKVLGICRGIQLINVAMGGNLIYDIGEYYGKIHDGAHELNWKVETPLKDVFPMVNSMHHQCLKTIASHLPYIIIANEPSTGSIESVTWADRYLGVQFHPEFMEKRIGEKFGLLIQDWVEGKTKLVTTPESSGAKIKKTNDHENFVVSLGQVENVWRTTSNAVWVDSTPSNNEENDEEEPF
jgi:gamma-glutamyl-gamma-aminobutyrate hydrolase PuuD